MEVVSPRCCGIDVHKKRGDRVPGAAGIGRAGDAGGAPLRDDDPRSAGLSDWLVAGGVTHLAMESTGVYWKPIWNLLEAQITLLLVSA